MKKEIGEEIIRAIWKENYEKVVKIVIDDVVIESTSKVENIVINNMNKRIDGIDADVKQNNLDIRDIINKINELSAEQERLAALIGETEKVEKAAGQKEKRVCKACGKEVAGKKIYCDECLRKRTLEQKRSYARSKKKDLADQVTEIETQYQEEAGESIKEFAESLMRMDG